MTFGKMYNWRKKKIVEFYFGFNHFIIGSQRRYCRNFYAGNKHHRISAFIGQCFRKYHTVSDLSRIRRTQYNPFTDESWTGLRRYWTRTKNIDSQTPWPSPSTQRNGTRYNSNVSDTAAPHPERWCISVPTKCAIDTTGCSRKIIDNAEITRFKADEWRERIYS